MERVDRYLLVPFLILVFIGSLMVFSASINIKTPGGFLSLFLKHIAIMGIGTGFLLAGLLIPIETWQRFVYPLMLVTFLLLVAILVPGVSEKIKGAKRWISLPFGFNFQPSFLGKWVLVLFMASSLSRKSTEKIKSFWKGMMPYMVILGALGVLFLCEPDFGGFMVVSIIAAMMMIMAGTKLIYWIGITVLMSPALYFTMISSEYRLKRIMAFTDPWKYAQSYSYQVIQSIYSFASGGLTGVGIGQGRQKLYFLPEAHTDFVFAVVGEEFGFLGALLVVLCFVLITCRGFSHTLRLKDDRFLSLMAGGFTLLIAIEGLLNMMVTLSLLPPKGLPLPFLSYGGTATIFYMLSMGILLNLSRRKPCMPS